jgi:hypothetical protein
MDVSSTSSVFMEGNVVESADIDLMNDPSAPELDSFEAARHNNTIPSDTGKQI